MVIAASEKKKKDAGGTMWTEISSFTQITLVDFLKSFEMCYYQGKYIMLSRAERREARPHSCAGLCVAKTR